MSGEQVVFVLSESVPHEGGSVLGVYSTLELAQADTSPDAEWKSHDGSWWADCPNGFEFWLIQRMPVVAARVSVESEGKK